MTKNKEDKIPTWSTVKVKLGGLVPYDKNPRQISIEKFELLKKNIQKRGYAELIAVNTDNTIIAGHQRVRALKELGYKDDFEIEVRIPDYKMSPEDFRQYLLQSNKVTGTWDYDILADCYEEGELFEAGFSKMELELDNWESDLDEAVSEEKEKKEETIKILCQTGFKESIVEMIEPILQDLDVKIK